MRLMRTKAMAFSIHSDSVTVMSNAVDRGPGGYWAALLERCYMCCEHVPLAEMDSENPSVVAEFFIRHSHKQHWQMRQMPPLGHMDIIAVGMNLYMLYFKQDAGTDLDNYRELPMPSTPELTLIELKELEN